MTAFSELFEEARRLQRIAGTPWNEVGEEDKAWYREHPMLESTNHLVSDVLDPVVEWMEMWPDERRELTEKIHQAVLTVINSMYGTDDRHAFAALKAARKVTYDEPIPWHLDRRPKKDAPLHILTVTALDADNQHCAAPVVEYALEHPDCLAYETQAFDVNEDGHTFEANVYSSSSHECGVGLMIQDAGFLDAIGVTTWGPGLTHVTEHLAPGRYGVEVWTQHHPSTPNGPEEWDSGVYVTRMEDES